MNNEELKQQYYKRLQTEELTKVNQDYQIKKIAGLSMHRYSWGYTDRLIEYYLFDKGSVRPKPKEEKTLKMAGKDVPMFMTEKPEEGQQVFTIIANKVLGIEWRDEDFNNEYFACGVFDTEEKAETYLEALRSIVSGDLK